MNDLSNADLAQLCLTVWRMACVFRKIDGFASPEDILWNYGMSEELATWVKNSVQKTATGSTISS